MPPKLNRGNMNGSGNGGIKGNGNNRGRGRGRGGGGRRGRFQRFNNRVNSGRVQNQVQIAMQIPPGPGSFNRGHPANVFQRLSINHNQEDRSQGNGGYEENPGISRRNYDNNSSNNNNSQLFGFRRNNPNGNNNNCNNDNGNNNNSDGGLMPMPFSSQQLGRPFNNVGAGIGNGMDGGNGSGVFGRMETNCSFNQMKPHQPMNPFCNFGAGNGNGRFGNGNGPYFSSGRQPLFSNSGVIGRTFMSSMPQQKNALCKFHADSPSGCTNRFRCSYMHEEFPCKLYHVQGQCGDGNNCRFSHDALDPLKLNALLMHLERPENCPKGFPWMTRTEIVAAIERMVETRDRSMGPTLASSSNKSNNNNNSKESKVNMDNAKASNQVERINPFRMDSEDSKNQKVKEAATTTAVPVNEIRVLSETTKTIPTTLIKTNDDRTQNTNQNQVENQKGNQKDKESAGGRDEPTIHHIIQAMRRTLQQHEDNKKKLKEKLEKENQDRAQLQSNTNSNSYLAGKNSPASTVQRISRTRPSLEQNTGQGQGQIVQIQRSQNRDQTQNANTNSNQTGTGGRQLQSNIMNNSGMDFFLTPADKDERFQLPSTSNSSSCSNSPVQNQGQLLPFAQTHLDVPVVSMSQASGALQQHYQNQIRVLPTMDEIIASCIGHGPPYTIWQTCQIYNTCAHHGLQVSIHDFTDFHFHTRRHRESLGLPLGTGIEVKNS